MAFLAFQVNELLPAVKKSLKSSKLDNVRQKLPTPALAATFIHHMSTIIHDKNIHLIILFRD